MVKKKVQKVPLGQAGRVLREQDAAEASGAAEGSSSGTQADVEAITESLTAEFDALDSSLILALLSDYPADEIRASLETIREQLGILQASMIPDDTASDTGTYLDPSQSTSVSDVAEAPERSSLPSERSEARVETGIGAGGASGNKRTGGASTSKSSRQSKADRSKRSTDVSGAGTESRSSRSLASSSTSPTSVSPSEEEPSLDDELELLKSLFPNLKRKDLRQALDDAVSVQAAIDQLLSVELIKNVEDSGIWPGEENVTDEEEGGPFQAVSPKRVVPAIPLEVAVDMARSGSASSQTSTSSKKSKAKAKHYALIDTLQRVPTPSSHSASRAQSPAPLARAFGLSGPSPNAWHTLASLASQLADLLPPHTEQYFTTFLHSPDYRCAHQAVRAALKRLPTAEMPDDAPSESILQDLYGLSLTDDQGDRNQDDLRAALRVAGGDVGVVMDLVELLEEISHWPGDEDNYDYGYSEDELDVLATLTKAAAASTGSKQDAPAPTITVDLPERFSVRPRKKQGPAPPKPRVIPGSEPAATSAAFPTARDDFGLPSSPRLAAPAVMPANRRQVHRLNWRKVEHERPAVAHPHAQNIPAYARGGFVADSDLSVADCLNRAAVERHKRETAIRAAGRHFAGHLPGGKAVNASVAGHYASQARQAGDDARSWELRAARLVVGAQLQRTGNTVDLHHLTTNEAVTVAREVVAKWHGRQQAAWGTGVAREGVFDPGKPLTVVTGVGNHSAGKRGVLGPAVAKALEADGWRIERGENARGYLVVRGKK